MEFKPLACHPFRRGNRAWCRLRKPSVIAVIVICTGTVIWLALQLRGRLVQSSFNRYPNDMFNSADDDAAKRLESAIVTGEFKRRVLARLNERDRQWWQSPQQLSISCERYGRTLYVRLQHQTVWVRQWSFIEMDYILTQNRRTLEVNTRMENAYAQCLAELARECDAEMCGGYWFSRLSDVHQ